MPTIEGIEAMVGAGNLRLRRISKTSSRSPVGVAEDPGKLGGGVLVAVVNEMVEER